MVEVTHEKLIRTFVKIRDARSELKTAWETKDRELKDKLDRLEQFMLQTMNDTGIESFKTAAGTAYRTTTLVPTGSDWTAFYKWVKENDAFDFIFRRIKADAVKDYMDQHDGQVPPGVSVFGKLGVTIRRK